jgi:hypothetical protein
MKLPSATRRNIYVCSLRAGERVMASVERFLERRLKVGINRAKSAVAPPSRAQVPRVQLYRRRGAQASHRPASHSPVQGTGARDDQRNAGREPRKDRRGIVALPHRVVRLLPLLRDAFAIAHKLRLSRKGVARRSLGIIGVGDRPLKRRPRTGHES